MAGATIAEQLPVVRAVIAATISDTIDAPLVSGPGEAGQSYLALVGGLGGFGRQLIDELLPLEQLMGLASGQDSTAVEGSLTETDLLLDSLMAQLHDEILNPAWPFRLEPPPHVDIRTINRIYNDTLRGADVAGGVVLNAEAEAADALLFADGEPTALLEAYRSFERQVDEASVGLSALARDAPIEDRARLQSKLDRLQAEWVGLGRRREVEQAFTVIRDAQTDLGFEDERAAVLQKFESGEKMRRDAPGLSYFRSSLVPTAPLLDQDSSSWQRVTLSQAQAKMVFTPRMRLSFALGVADVAKALDDIAEVTFEMLVCEIRRDWLDTDFFRERYWRLADSAQLSDGVGGGQLPCLPHKAVFVRNLTFSTNSVDVELVSPQQKAGTVTKVRRTPTRVKLASQPVDAVRQVELLKAANRVGLKSAARMISTEKVALASPNLLKVVMPLMTGPTFRATANVTVNPPQARTPQVSRRRPGDTRDHRAEKVLTRRKRVGDVIRVFAKPGKPGEAAVAVIGSIQVAADDKLLLDELFVSVVAHDPPVGSPEGIELDHHSPQHARFSTMLQPQATFDGVQESIRTYAIRLHDSDGLIVAEHIIDMSSADRKLRLEWKAVSEPNVFAIAENTPLVHAYVVRVIPKCPDPDESLAWT